MVKEKSKSKKKKKKLSQQKKSLIRIKHLNRSNKLT